MNIEIKISEFDDTLEKEKVLEKVESHFSNIRKELDSIYVEIGHTEEELIDICFSLHDKPID